MLAVLEELVASGRVVRDAAGEEGARFRSAIVTCEGRLRRAPGELRNRVLEFLQDRPGQEWGPTGLSRRLEASSGAISNALDRLVGLGLARQTGDRPRRFTAVTPDAAEE